MSETPPSPANAAAPPAERRRAPRYAIRRPCFARPPWPPGSVGERPEGWRCIACDVSAVGIGLVLPFPLAPGAELEVRPAAPPGVRPLRARVAHARPMDFAWLVGCALAEPLSEAELRIWLAEAGLG
jgi:hypothetical protein